MELLIKKEILKVWGGVGWGGVGVGGFQILCVNNPNEMPDLLLLSGYKCIIVVSFSSFFAAVLWPCVGHYLCSGTSVNP